MLFRLVKMWESMGPIQCHTQKYNTGSFDAEQGCGWRVNLGLKARILKLLNDQNANPYSPVNYTSARPGACTPANRRDPKLCPWSPVRTLFLESC